MKISRHHIYNYFAKWSADADDAGIRITYDNLVLNDDFYYKYAEIDPKTETCRRGYTEWAGWSLLFFVLSVVVATVGKYSIESRPILVFVVTFPLTLSILFYSLRFIKRTCLFFFSKKGRAILCLTIPRDQAFADFIIERIRNANVIQNNGSNHGLESTGAPPAAGTPETHP